MKTLTKALAIVSFPDVTRETNTVNLLFQRIIIDRCEKQNVNFLADFAKHLHIDVSFFLKKRMFWKSFFEKTVFIS